MRPGTLALAGLATLLAAGLCLSQPALQPGYLTAQTAPDTLKILPPSPKSGDPQDTADQAIFRETRALEGTPRWALAQNDASEALPAMLKDFSCAVGVTLDPDKAPRLSAILLKARADAIRAVDEPKNFYKRPRPYQVTDAPTCVDKSPNLAKSADYPSGHATWSWTVGLILAELAPDRATEILVRARAFGESRVVCGVHNASAVDEGRTNGSILVAALHGDPTFRADLEGARSEMAALRAAGGPAPTACEAETALTSKTPW